MAKFGFDSWMAEDNRFWSSMAKTKLWQELDGQKWTFSKKKKEINEDSLLEY
jgi:hypothetical protein